MAARPEAEGGLRQSLPRETLSNGAGSDSIDALVSDFLTQLQKLSSDIKRIPKSDPGTGLQAANEIRTQTNPARPYPAPQLASEAISKTGFHLESINKEIEETLNKLERQTPTPIPESDRKDSAPVAFSKPARSEKPSTPESVSKQIAPQAEAPAIRNAEEQEWKKIDIFRTEYVSSRSEMRHRNLFITMMSIVVMVVLIYYSFFR